jgi:hypothetical protein
VECSLELAHSLFFRPWLEQGAEVLVSVNGSEDGAGLGKIDWISPGNGRLISISFTRSGANKTFDISNASRFSYEDLRNDPSVPSLVANRWDSFLLVESPDGGTLLFAKPKTD